MKTSILQQKSQQNQTTQKTTTSLIETDEKISKVLAGNLHTYAERRLNTAGFTLATEWEPEIYSTDGDRNPSDRTYCVRFKNNQGGFIEIIGIHTKNKKPYLDHGVEIGEE